MLPSRTALLLTTLLLGGCATPAHQQQLGQALIGLEGELARLEEELVAMNGLHYQSAADAPAALRRYLKSPAPTSEGLVPAEVALQDGPQLRYRYQLPDGMKALPLNNPCLRYEFELRHLGRLGRLDLVWQGKNGSGSRQIRQASCPFSARGPGLQ